jgi:hypothetical protein
VTQIKRHSDERRRRDLPLSEAIAKVARVADKDILTGFNQVGGGHIPAQSAGSSNDERLSRGEKNLAQESDRITEDCDEVGGDM